MSKAKKIMPPVHPGEILREDFLPDYGMSAYALAKALNVPRSRLNAIVRCERAVTADTAMRLARYFGTSAEMWLNMQTSYDLEKARDEYSDVIEKITPRAA